MTLKRLQKFFSYKIDSSVQLSSRLILVIAAIFVTFIVWAKYSSIDRVVSGVGKTVPASKLQTVEHFEGGRIEKIHVRQGQTVEKGEILITLSPVQAVGEYNIQKDLIADLTIRQSRLMAELSEADSFLNPLLATPAFETLYQQELDLLRQRRSKHLSELELKRAEIAKILSEQQLAEVNLITAQEELDTTQLLYDRGLESKLALTQVRAKYAESLSKKEVSAQLLQQAESELKRYMQGYRAEMLGELSTIRAQIAEAREELLIAADKADRLELRSPLRGTVNRVLVATVGATIGPGEPVVEIVPRDDGLVVEALIKPSDIGFVLVGQKVVVKYSAYDFSIYGSVEGSVSVVSRDSIVDDELGQRFYEVKISVPNSLVSPGGESLPLIAGMEAQADIIVGQRTVLQYLLSPINKTISESFKER